MRISGKVFAWGIALHDPPTSLADYQAKSRRFLECLQTRNREFRHLIAIGRKQVRAISPDLTGIEDDIAALLFDEAHRSDYLQLTKDGRLGDHSISRIGFSLTYGLLDSEGVLRPIEQGGTLLVLQGSSAGEESESTAILEVAADVGSHEARMKNFREFLEQFVMEWGCRLGGVVVTRFQQRVRGTERASYAGQWLFYLPFPHLANCLPEDIHHEPFANGILIQTTPHMPDADNPADVAAGIRVRDVLDEFGLVNDATYAIEGWPPDREEAIYEQFISGAPANRKYTVHCINFDGYDSERKVLLYAKLFRRLKRHPKEWGHRGWDGPVLNEAKRQVRAAEKAGGVPIEWHIGLEEPAHQVRQLLADYTDITEQQLRVIYTPLEEALSRSPP